MTNSFDSLPSNIKSIIILTGVMMIRVGAVNRLADLTPDKNFWLYPITIDLLVAITAPVVIHQLWKRRNATAWAAALVFHAVAFQDATVGLLFDMLLPMDGRAAGEGATPLIIIMLFGLIALWSLCHKSVRDYYLT